MADAVDDRPLKALLFHHNHLPKGLQEYNLYKRERQGEILQKRKSSARDNALNSMLQHLEYFFTCQSYSFYTFF